MPNLANLYPTENELENTMNKMKLATLVAGLFVGAAANAAIIDNGTFTRDTGLGLDYLDVGLVHGDLSFFQAGVAYDGRTWRLATANELANTWSSVTGLSLTSANILSGDNDMGAAPTASLVRLFDGVTSDVGSGGELVVGNYGVSGYYNYFAEGGLAVHTNWDDSHFQGLSGHHGAWLVTASVPEPETYAMLLVGLGLIGAASRKRKNK